MEKNIQSDSFEKCFQNIIKNNFQKALTDFTDSYYKDPNNILLICGIIISHLLLKSIDECQALLKKETAVSPLADKLSLIANFLKENPSFNKQDSISSILNVGLFLKKRNLTKEALVFFNSIQILEPGNQDNLAALGECSILEKDFQRGLKFFSQAAKEELNK